MTNELVRRFDPPTAQRIASAAQLAIVGASPVRIEILPPVRNRLGRFVGRGLHAPEPAEHGAHFAHNTAASSSLRPIPGPATRCHIALWRSCGCIAHSGNNRAPGGPAETRPGRVSISTRPHRRPHTAARALRESRPHLSPAGAPRQVAPPFAPDANSGDARSDRHPADRSESPWRHATVPATAPAWPACRSWPLLGCRALSGRVGT